MEDQSINIISLFNIFVNFRYTGEFIGEDASLHVREWVQDRIEAGEKVVYKAIQAAEFKSHPDEFKNVKIKQDFIGKSCL